MKWVLIAVLAAIAITGASAAPGDVEFRAYTALAPGFADDFGAGVAIQFAALPDNWVVIGGRMLFIDVIQLEDQTILGGSMSFRPERNDDGLRFWGALWQDGGGGWAAGLSTRVANW